jgi:hypothetical protein
VNWHWPHVTRDVVLFVSGLGLLIYEAVFRDTARRRRRGSAVILLRYYAMSCLYVVMVGWIALVMLIAVRPEC